MPKIPVFNEQTVASQPVAPPKMQDAPAGAFGEALGAGLQNFGNTVAHVQIQAAMKQREESEATQYHGAVNKVLAIDEGVTTQAQKLQGEDYTKPVNGELPSDTLLKNRQTEIDAIIHDLPKRVQDQVRVAADRSGVTVRRNLDNHFLQQGEVLKAANADAALTNLQTYVQSHPYDVDGANDRLGNALAANAAKYKGLPEAQKQFERSLTANVLVGQVRGMITANDPEGAKKYFDAHAEEMTASAHYADTKSLVEGGLANKQGYDLANQQWATVGPKSVGQKIDEVKLMSFADGIKDDKVRDIYRSEIQKRVAVQTADTARVSNDLQNKYWLHYRNHDLDKWLTSNPDGIQLKSQDFAELYQALSDKRQSYADQAKARAERDQHDPSTLHKQAVEYYKLLSDPTKLAAMSPEQIGALWPTYGAYTEHLQQAAIELRQPSKMIEAKADAEDLKLGAIQAGLQPFSSNDAMQERVVKFNQFVETAIDAAQTQNGNKPLSRTEKQAIIKQAQQQVTFYRPGLIWDSVDTKLPSDIDPAKDSLNVPAADQAEIKQALAKYGITNPTPQQLWNGWQKLQRDRKKK